MVLRIEKFVKTKGTIEKARINTIFFGHNYTYDHLDLFFRSDFYTRQDQCTAEKSLKNQSVAQAYSFLQIWSKVCSLMKRKNNFWVFFFSEITISPKWAIPGVRIWTEVNKNKNFLFWDSKVATRCHKSSTLSFLKLYSGPLSW